VAIQLQAAMMALIGFYGLWQTINQVPGWPLFALASAVGLISAFRMVVQGTHPERIEIDDEEIRFIAFGRTKRFRLDHLAQFKIKDIDPKRKIFIRIADENGTKGRIWLSFDKYKDAEDLTYWLHDLEYKLNPDDLKYHNRRLAEKKAKKAAQKSLEKAAETKE
jgi:hypothetical protein